MKLVNTTKNTCTHKKYSQQTEYFPSVPLQQRKFAMVQIWPLNPPPQSEVKYSNGKGSQGKELPGNKIGLHPILLIKDALPATKFIIFVLDLSEWPCWQITLSPVPGTWAVLTTLPLADFASTLFQPSSHMTSLRGFPPHILHWTSMQWSQNCNFVTNVLLKADPFPIAQTNSNTVNCLYSQTSYQLAKNLPNTKQLHDFKNWLLFIGFKISGFYGVRGFNNRKH